MMLLKNVFNFLFWFPIIDCEYKKIQLPLFLLTVYHVILLKSVISFSFFLWYLYWSITALQCCVSFCCTKSESAISIHISPYPLPLKPPSHPPYLTPLGQEETCTTMFIAALFTITRTWKQPKCPSTEK